MQYYDPSSASRRLRLKEEQEPNLFVGYHREWSPGVHTLFLGMRVEDDFSYADPFAILPLFKQTEGPITAINPGTGVLPNKLRVSSQFEGYSAELQQIFATPMNTFILGGRLQYGDLRQFQFDQQRLRRIRMLSMPRSRTSPIRGGRAFMLTTNGRRGSQLQFTVGVTYDQLEFPENIDTPPFAKTHDTEEKVSPKVGFIWTPEERTHVRGAYTRSLGGVFF